MEEIWKDVPGYAGYQASSLGRIKVLSRYMPRNYMGRVTMKRFPENILNGRLNEGGYRTYKVYLNGVQKGMLGHRMVLLAFIENKYNKPFCNHINSIRDDNRPENLEWCTHVENTKHSIEHNPLRNNFRFNRVDIMVLNKETGIYYNSVTEAYRSSVYKYGVASFKDRFRGRVPNDTNFVKV